MKGPKWKEENATRLRAGNCRTVVEHMSLHALSGPNSRNTAWTAKSRISGIGGLPVYDQSTPCSKEPCSTFCSDELRNGKKRARHAWPNDLGPAEMLLGTRPFICCLDQNFCNRWSTCLCPVYSLFQRAEGGGGGGERGDSCTNAEEGGSGSQCQNSKLNRKITRRWNHLGYISCPRSEMDVLSNTSAREDKQKRQRGRTRARHAWQDLGPSSNQTVQAQESKTQNGTADPESKPKPSSCLGPLIP